MAGKKLYALVTVAVLAVALPILAQKTAPALKQDGSPDAGRRDPSRVQAVTVDGGPVEKMYTATNNEFTLIGEDPNFVPVPGMIRKFQVGCAGATLGVTFSAETQLRGDAGDFDWIEVEVRLDGAPMQPHDSGSPTAYSGNENYSMNSGTFVQRVGPGEHTVQAFWRLVDNQENNNLSGWIDDTTLLILQSQAVDPPVPASR